MEPAVVADITGGEQAGSGRGGNPYQRAMTPALYRVAERRVETDDVTTLTLSPLAGGSMTYRPGQFNMLTAFGVGEAAISVSSAPRHDGRLEHTVRNVGSVTGALCQAAIGETIGVRGPFGTDWEVQGTDIIGAPLDVPIAEDNDNDPGDIVVVAGGIGLAPLRGAIYELAARRDSEGGRVFVIVGAREPSQIIFREDLEAWASAGTQVAVTVDAPTPGWTGHVGLVTSLLEEAGFDPMGARALVCGPEIMIRFTARTLIDLGVDPSRIRVSLERNMQCGVAWCGHCQLGPFLLCRDGPVVPYAGVVSHLLTQRQR